MKKNESNHRSRKEEEPIEREPDLIIETLKTDVHKTALSSLYEILIRGDNYKWRFYKNDVDNWPSKLHGHDYDKKLKLDAFTGDIYNVNSRKKVSKLNKKSLKKVQDKLKSSSDFSHFF